LGRKKRFSFLTWAILVSTLMCGVYFVYSLWQMGQIQRDATNYAAAPHCEQESSCRKVVRAQVLDSRTIDASTYISTGNYGSSYKKDEKVAYWVVLKLENLEKYKVIVLPNLEMNANLFGVPNVYFPIQSGVLDIFAERSFPTGVNLDVETWNGQITLIYSQYVNSAQAANTLTFAEPTSPSSTNASDLSKAVTTYAIPTTDNPLVAGEIMQDKFGRSLATIVIFPILFIVLKISSKKR
jgi:hypothetical protein